MFRKVQNWEDLKVPRLRFPGFEGEWKERKLGEISEIKTGNKDTQNKVDGGEYPFFVRSNTVERINSYSYDGEAILTSGDGVGVGKNFHYIEGKFDFHQRVYALRNFKIGYSGKFIYSVFSEKFYDRVKRLSAKNSVDSVRIDMISSMKIHFPNFIEQKKIASFLSLIDERIQTQNKIIEGLENLIKGLSEKLFFQKIRFEEFSEKWKEITLNEVLREPKQIPVEEPNKIELLTVKLHCKGIENTGNYPAVTKNGRPYYKRLKNEILIGRQNFHNGGIGIVKKENAGKICSNAISSYNVIKDNLMFIYYNISRPYFYTKVNDMIGGTGQKEISKTEFLKLGIQIPCIQEQNKIAYFLSSLNQKLGMEKQALKSYQTQKNYLLQNLFI